MPTLRRKDRYVSMLELRFPGNPEMEELESDHKL